MYSAIAFSVSILIIVASAILALLSFAQWCIWYVKETPRDERNVYEAALLSWMAPVIKETIGEYAGMDDLFLFSLLGFGVGCIVGILWPLIPVALIIWGGLRLAKFMYQANKLLKTAQKEKE